MLMTLAAFASLSTAHAETSPGLAGFGTSTGAAVMAVPGAIGGVLLWSAADRGDGERCEGAFDNCTASASVRTFLVGMPLGATMAEVGGGVLTHQLFVGHGGKKVFAAGAGAAGGSMGLIGVGWLVIAASDGGDTAELGSLLILTGVSAAIVAPPIAMGIVSHNEVGQPAVARGPGVRDVGFLAVEGGGGLTLGGVF